MKSFGWRLGFDKRFGAINNNPFTFSLGVELGRAPYFGTNPGDLGPINMFMVRSGIGIGSNPVKKY